MSGVDSVDEDGSTPLWKYVTDIVKIGKGSGNVQFKCTYCNQTFKGSYSRVKGHLLKIKNTGANVCKKITPKQIEEMRRIQEEADLKVKRAQQKKVPLPSQSAARLNVSSSGSIQYPFDNTKKRKGPVGPLEKAFNCEARELVNVEIARMFYTGGLPFNLARNPHYKRSYNMLASRPIPGYTTRVQYVEDYLTEKGERTLSDNWNQLNRFGIQKECLFAMMGGLIPKEDLSSTSWLYLIVGQRF